MRKKNKMLRNVDLYHPYHPLKFRVEESIALKIWHCLEYLFFRVFLQLFKKKIENYAIVDLKSKNNLNYGIASYFHHLYGYSLLCEAGFSDESEHAYVVMEAIDNCPYESIDSILKDAEKSKFGLYWSTAIHTYVCMIKNGKIYTSIEECKIDLMLEGEADPEYEDIQIDILFINSIGLK